MKMVKLCLFHTSTQVRENVDVCFVEGRHEFAQVNIRHVVHKIFESTSHLHANTNTNKIFSQVLV
jgi:hypothetical protein